MDLGALCEAIDNGQMDVLPILADYLEENGNSLATGLRIILAAPHTVYASTLWENGKAGWRDDPLSTSLGKSAWSGGIPSAIYNRLPTPTGRGFTHTHSDVRMRVYENLSSAFLALAIALTE